MKTAKTTRRILIVGGGRWATKTTQHFNCAVSRRQCCAWFHMLPL